MYIPEFEKEAAKVADNIPNIEKLYNSTILMTGGSGMILSAVSDVIFYFNKAKNANIKILFASRSKEENTRRFTDDTNWEYVEFDATKGLSQNIEADYLIYGASNADPATVGKYPVETILMNTDGFNSVVKNTTFKRGLYISSSEVYGNDSVAPYKEDDYGYIDILNPRACYPVAKRLAETLCASYGSEYDKDFVIVRPGHIYGPTISPRDSRASAVFSRLASEGQDIIMKSDGSQLRSYCYVYDCASALLTVLINGKKSNAYNISNPDSIVSIKQIAEALAEQAGVKVIQETATETEKASYNLMTNSSLNSEKLESLGWKAAYSLADGTKRTIEILRAIASN